MTDGRVALLALHRGPNDLYLVDSGDWLLVEVEDSVNQGAVTLDAGQVDTLIAALVEWRKGAA